MCPLFNGSTLYTSLGLAPAVTMAALLVGHSAYIQGVMVPPWTVLDCLLYNSFLVLHTSHSRNYKHNQTHAFLSITLPITYL